MIKFNKMWNDVCCILSKNNSLNNQINVIQNYENGFIIKDNDGNSFLNKEDFIDFWCKMLYFNQVSKQEIKNNDKKQTYIYKIIKKLPYVNEDSETLKLIG